MFPEIKKCEVCGVDVRCIPFPELHILCPGHSSAMTAKLKPLLNGIIEELKKENTATKK